MVLNAPGPLICRANPTPALTVRLLSLRSTAGRPSRPTTTWEKSSSVRSLPAPMLLSTPDSGPSIPRPLDYFVILKVIVMVRSALLRPGPK